MSWLGLLFHPRYEPCCQNLVRYRSGEEMPKRARAGTERASSNPIRANINMRGFHSRGTEERQERRVMMGRSLGWIVKFRFARYPDQGSSASQRQHADFSPRFLATAVE